MDNKLQLQELIKNALKEDVGDGDHSTLASIDPGAEGKAILKIKDLGIIAGIDVAQKIYLFVQPDARFYPHKKDGDKMDFGETAFTIEGKIHMILKCERLVLNCMQRMSGIATLTRKYVDKLKKYHTRLLDTRKTTPNFRLLEKEAVRIGGALNHRFGLYDMIMLKDNHIDYCGGIEKAIELASRYVKEKKPGLKIEIEARNINDVNRIVAAGNIDRIMLDNFSPPEIIDALKIVDRKYETEASGGINFDNLEEYAQTGVDFISSGAIIHQATSLDLSLKASIV